MTTAARASSVRAHLRSGAALATRAGSGVLVYALLFGVLVGGVVLPPLLGLLHVLGRYDGNEIVGNYSILPWVLSGRGLAWGFLLLSSSLLLLVLFLAGLFLLFARRNGSKSLARVYLEELWKRLPEVLWISTRWSLVVVAAVLLLAVVPGLCFLGFLTDHDINYYLKVQPTEWALFVGISVVWMGGVGFLLLRALLRISIFFPLWVRGHGGLRQSVRESWTLTRGHERRLATLLVVPAAIVSVVHIALNIVLFQVISLLLPLGADSLRGALLVIAGGILLFVVEHFAVFCAGVAWICGTWSVLCDELCPVKGGDSPEAMPPAKDGTRTLRALILAAACAVLVVTVLRAVKPPGEIAQARPLVIAHRGGAGEAPENSLEAFGLVLAKRKADMIEFDVAMTSDGVLVLAHDSDLMRQAGEPRKLAELAWDEMSRLELKTPQSKGNQVAPVALLEDALTVIGTNCPMIVEFKHSKRTPDLVARTVDVVARHGLMMQAIFMSLDLDDVLAVRALVPDAKIGYFVSVEMGNYRNLDVDCIAPRHTLVTRKVLAELKERKVPVFAWTVGDSVRIVELLELGVDGIITNEPTRTRRLVDAYFLIPPEVRSLLRFRRLWDFLVRREEFKGLVDMAGEEFQP